MRFNKICFFCDRTETFHSKVKTKRYQRISWDWWCSSYINKNKQQTQYEYKLWFFDRVFNDFFLQGEHA